LCPPHCAPSSGSAWSKESRTSTMRIGLIAPPWVPVPPTGYGGTEGVVDCLARGLQAAGEDVVLFATGDSTCQVPRQWAYDHPQAPMGLDVAEARHLVRAYQALADRDVIHDHTLLGPFFAGGNPSVVTTNHGPFTSELREIYGAVAHRVPIIAISRSQRAEAPELPIAAVIHHGIDPEAFPVGTGGGGYLLFLGRMTPEKGVHRAIEVARRVGLPLVIAAKMREPDEHRYFAECVEPHLRPGIDYVGEVHQDDKLALLGGARALLNPITWAEPFGLVMVEALACGTPVLTFPNGAAPEIVEHGRTGFHCRDVQSMAAAVQQIDLLDRADCRAAVEGHFSSRRMVDEHLVLYRALLERRRSQGRGRLLTVPDPGRRQPITDVASKPNGRRRRDRPQRHPGNLP
jgi:glycosyltransferase involved in cell wall biosynthesis